ncbi:MAG: hypothetical protein P1V20_14045 [Verrucomicrobiales bacterium]|nr:hypothetical protein [Verrucomicrobiales bacterium]
MWETTTSLLQPGVSRLSIHPADDDAAVTFRSFFEHCSTSAGFADFISAQLAASPYGGFFWECPAIALATLDNPFECVVVDGPALPKLTANPAPFAGQFAKVGSGKSVAVFENLGGDATLISPLPEGADLTIYPHFASFLRNGPPSQKQEFWRELGETALRLVSPTPFWLSTAGLGVSWLHLRFDSRPKYFRYQPYKKA